MDRRDSYYRYDDDYYGRGESRRRSEYWDEHYSRKPAPVPTSSSSQSRPILVISKNCLPFIRGALEDLKKIYYYYNCIDVSSG